MADADDTGSPSASGLRRWMQAKSREASRGDGGVRVSLQDDPSGPAPKSASEVLDTLARVAASAERVKIEDEIARGGMGAIKTVYDRALQRHAAMKVLHGDLREDAISTIGFVREAQILGQLDHPNIVPIYEIGVDEQQRPYFLMKLVEGVTLSAIIRQLPNRALSDSELFDVLELVVKLCDALSFAHSRGVLHLDIKPANVMVGEFGEVYLMDWGVAKLQRRQVDQMSMTQTGLVTGTPSHMAPEQAAAGKLDERTDVFAVGALIYHIIARRGPYSGHPAVEALLKASEADYRPLGEVAREGRLAAELTRIVNKAMARDPEERYQSVERLRADIVRFMRGGGEFPRQVYERGENVVREGELGDAAYIIEEGACEVYKMIDGERLSLRIMVAGEVFGETAILTQQPRSASVVATERTVLQVVTKAVLDEEVASLKPWMGALVRILAQRFREREQDRRDARPQANETSLMRLSLMHVATWGRRDAGGSLTASWSKAVHLFDTMLHKSDAQDWSELMAAIDGIEVDREHDLLTILRPEAIRARLEWADA